MPTYPLLNINPDAVWKPGPTHKTWGYVSNEMLAVCMHSMEGYESGAWDQLFGPAQVSWHFSVMQNGVVYQHYPLAASPWHAGSEYQNKRLIGIEHEGVKGEALTEAQLAASIRLVHWIGVQCGWVPSLGADTRRTIYLHSDASATTCPNGRIPLDRYVAPVVLVPPVAPVKTTKEQLLAQLEVTKKLVEAL